MITSNPKIILTNESYFKFYNSIYINMFVDDKISVLIHINAIDNIV